MNDRDKKDVLLLLIALSGELPADWVGRAAGSGSYGAALLTRLKKEGYIKVRSGDGIRGYLLRERGKQYLREKYGKDVAGCLAGAASTNHVKSEPEKRLRLHRMAMAWIFCYEAGIRIFTSEKPELFPASHTVPYKPDTAVYQPFGAYYGCGEWKLDTDLEIRGSRACGILAAESCYILYNTMDSLMKWAPKTERNLRSRMEMRLYRSGRCLKGALFLGTGMNMLGRLLKSDGGLKGTLYRMDDTYERLYFIPMERAATLQLQLLSNGKGLEKLEAFLRTSLASVRPDSGSLEAGTDSEGRQVYFCFLLEMWKLRRILTLPNYREGRIFCFTYQAQELRRIFPDSFIIDAIRPERVRQYLGWENPGTDTGKKGYETSAEITAL